MKKAISLLLFLSLLLGIYIPASAAGPKTETMRVHLEEGTVTVRDAAGAALPFSDGMPICSGCSVETGDGSSAYISLDDFKVIKLDMNTSVTVNKSGRRIRVKLTAGQLVFNVTEPLAGNEALEIRTGTMATSIRGSSGAVTLRKVIYVTGHGTAYQFDEFGAMPKGFEIWGGQLLELKDDGSEAKIENAQVSDIPSVYLKEVEQNEQLQQSLESEGNYSADELIAEVPAAEKREEEKREAAKESSSLLPDSGGYGNTDGGDNNTDPAFQKKSEDDPQENVPLIPSYPVVPYDTNPVEEPVYTISWIVEGSQPVTTSVKRGQVPEYPGEAPVREEDAEFTYTFDHWEPHPIAAKENTTYTAVFTETRKTYPVRFIDEDGTELQSSILPYGETPVFYGETPAKPATAQYTYTFDGWTPEIEDVTGNATYQATFKAVQRQPDVYQITWIDGSDTPKYSTVNAGEIPAFPGDTAPAKAADEQYTYTFSKWDTEPAAAAGDATYTAVFDRAPRKYAITFVDEDGTVLKEAAAYAYGTAAADILKPDDPTRAATSQYTYTFAGWTPEITDVTRDTIYTATYTSTVNQYTVTFVNDDGSILKAAAKYDFGTPAADILRPDDPTKTGYTFAGWDTIPDTMPANDVTVTAMWTLNQYTLNVILPAGIKSITVGDRSYSADSAALTYTAAHGTELTVSYVLADGYIAGPATALTAGGTVLAEGGNASGKFTVNGAADITVTAAYLVLNEQVLEDCRYVITVPSAIHGSVSAEQRIEQQADLYITDGSSLNLEPGSLTLAAGAVLTNDGTITIELGSELTNDGAIINNGTITNSGTLTNKGTLNNYSSNGITNNRYLFNTGTLNNGVSGDAAINGRILNGGDAYLLNCGILACQTAVSSIENAGLFLIKATYDDTSDFSCIGEFDAVVTGDGTFADNGGRCGDDAFWYGIDYSGGDSDITIIGSGAIKEDAFYGMDNNYDDGATINVTIEEGITSIASQAFDGFTKLFQVKFPSSVYEINGSAFDSCSGLQSILFCDGLTAIRGSAFLDCTALCEFDLPETLESIGPNAFDGCTSIFSVTFPSSVTSIGSSAFFGCVNLESAHFACKPPETFGDYVFYLNDEGSVVTIPGFQFTYDDTDPEVKAAWEAEGVIIDGKWNGYNLLIPNIDLGS